MSRVRFRDLSYPGLEKESVARWTWNTQCLRVIEAKLIHLNPFMSSAWTTLPGTKTTITIKLEINSSIEHIQKYWPNMLGTQHRRCLSGKELSGKPDKLNLIPRSHRVGRGDWFQKIGFCLLCMCCSILCALSIFLPLRLSMSLINQSLTLIEFMKSEKERKYPFPM